MAAAALGAHPLELLLNGGGTEGDNHVLLGLAGARGHAGHIVTTALEHSALLAPGPLVADAGRGRDVPAARAGRDRDAGGAADGPAA